MFVGAHGTDRDRALWELVRRVFGTKNEYFNIQASRCCGVNLKGSRFLAGCNILIHTVH